MTARWYFWAMAGFGLAYGLGLIVELMWRIT